MLPTPQPQPAGGASCSGARSASRTAPTGASQLRWGMWCAGAPARIRPASHRAAAPLRLHRTAMPGSYSERAPHKDDPTPVKSRWRAGSRSAERRARVADRVAEILGAGAPVERPRFVARQQSHLCNAAGRSRPGAAKPWRQHPQLVFGGHDPLPARRYTGARSGRLVRPVHDPSQLVAQFQHDGRVRQPAEEPTLPGPRSSLRAQTKGSRLAPSLRAARPTERVCDQTSWRMLIELPA
jgi:hypothetical protein